MKQIVLLVLALVLAKQLLKKWGLINHTISSAYYRNIKETTNYST